MALFRVFGIDKGEGEGYSYNGGVRAPDDHGKGADGL